MRCNGDNQHGWSKCVDSGVWAMSHLVLTCYAHGYGKVGNCPTLGHIVLCHYTWRWLLALNSKAWMKRLCLLIANIIDYFGCDCKTCYFMCAKGFTLWSVIVEGPRWSDMEGPCAQLCTMSSSQCGWPNGPIFSHASSWPMMYVVWASFRSHHNVDLWQVFLTLAYGMFHATNGRNVNGQMVMPLVHPIDLGS
jgi:hypothetical protein